MRVMKDFVCPECGSKFEKLIDNSVGWTYSPCCNVVAQSKFSPPKAIHFQQGFEAVPQKKRGK